MDTAIFQAFIATLDAAQTEAELHDALSAATRALGFDSFAYMRAPSTPAEVPIGITDFPEAWVDRYKALNCIECDPVVMQARVTSLPFVWGTEAEVALAFDNEEQAAHFASAYEHGIRGGYTVPIHDGAGWRALISFVSDDAQRVQLILKSHEPLIQLMAAYFHAAVEEKLLQKPARAAAA